MKRFALIFSLGVFWGCSFDVDANPGERCDDVGECPSGLTCHRGFCVGMGAACSNEGTPRECYDADAALVGTGVCRAGEQVCTDGVQSACSGQVLPRTEVCNGVDDDCNGAVDDIAGMNCVSETGGVCASGVLECRQGTEFCAPNLMPSSESCNGTDQDCDGQIDEGTDEVCFPGVEGCSLNADGDYECVGSCSAGLRVCVGGELGACEGAVLPADEDGCTAPGTTAVDDDCDGQTDEDCVCTGADTQACYGGPSATKDVGACQSGMQTCSGGSFGECVGQVVPSAETCGNDGVDNDCDGVVDNVARRGASCIDADALGVCRSGVLRCMDGGLSCMTPSAGTETCNGLDDDCDGDTDEEFVLATDRNHCGACGNTCAEGLDCCGGSCIDTQTVEAHCGSCGDECGTGRECCGGDCLNLDTDRLNCGVCGNECADGWDCCEGNCTDIRANPGNCGVCGRDCEGTLTCCGGVCADPNAPACTECAMDCAASGLTCCGVSCVDRATDENNCGSCGNVCESGQVCCDGNCFDNDESHCGQGCNVCGDDDLCCGGSCVADNAANCTACGMSCGDGQTCCGDGCFNLQTDETRCGDCDADACSSGEVCSSGHCCPSGEEWCNGACVDIDNSNSHCGGCGNVCVRLGLGLCSCREGHCQGVCI